MGDSQIACTTVLFDFDGVIADTEQGRYTVFAGILAEQGLDFKARVSLSQMQGLTGRAMMKRYFPELSAEEALSVVRRREQIYMANLDTYCIPYPGVKETVTALKERGYYLANTTANSTETAGILLRHVGIFHLFDKVLGYEYCENPATGKKDYGKVAGLTGRTVAESVVVEDSPVGIKGARMHGYYTIAFERHPHPDIQKYANRVMHTYAELDDFFGISPLHEK